MLPLVPSGLLTGTREPTAVPPPPSFRAAGKVKAAGLSSLSPHLEGKADTPARAAGKRYEQKVQTYLKDILRDFLIGPWFWYTDEVGMHYCQPDIFYISVQPRAIVVAEIKLQHMPEAWWQLRRLYEPVIRAAFPEHGVRVLEICASFDPAMPFPEEVVLVNDFKDVLKESRMGVLVWKP